MIVTASASSDAVAYARLHPRTIHGHEGFARTADGGLNWDVIERAPSGLILADPQDADVVYVAGSSCDWCRSSDGGATFTDVAPTVTRPAPATALGAQRNGNRFWMAL